MQKNLCQIAVCSALLVISAAALADSSFVVSGDQRAAPKLVYQENGSTHFVLSEGSLPAIFVVDGQSTKPVPFELVGNVAVVSGSANHYILAGEGGRSEVFHYEGRSTGGGTIDAEMIMSQANKAADVQVASSGPSKGLAKAMVAYEKAKAVGFRKVPVQAVNDQGGILPALAKAPSSSTSAMDANFTSSEVGVVKVNFGANETQIAEDNEAALLQIVSNWKSNKTKRIILRGRGDNSESEAAALNRVIEARSFLIKRGVHASKIRMLSKARFDYIASNESEEGRSQNRRIEVEMTDSNQSAVFKARKTQA